jgi:hypothetical protein
MGPQFRSECERLFMGHADVEQELLSGSLTVFDVAVQGCRTGVRTNLFESH